MVDFPGTSGEMFVFLLISLSALVLNKYGWIFFFNDTFFSYNSAVVFLAGRAAITR